MSVIYQNKQDILSDRSKKKVGKGREREKKASTIETEPTSEAGVLDGEWRADRRD